MEIKAGSEIGYAVVSESDNHLDVFGNVQKGSAPIVWESPLNNSLTATRERAESVKAYGRRLICKLVVVEEVV